MSKEMPANTSVTTERDVPTLRERAYGAFTDRLLTRDILPGQFVSQRELVEVTGMPLGAIRELIPRLEVEGLVKTVPQRGIQIAHVDLTLVKEAFQLRLFLEKEAIALFVENASQREIERLHEDHLKIVRRVEKGEESAELVADAQAVDWGLHDAIIDALGNQIVQQIYRVNSIKIRLIRQELTRIDGRLVLPVMREHLTILDALVARDKAGTVQALCNHVASARSRALGL